MKRVLWIILFICLSLLSPSSVMAIEGSVLGIHILNPGEASQAHQLLQYEGGSETWHYVTIPLTLNDLTKKDQWQSFFLYAKEQKLIPLVRLSSRFENGTWQIPNKKEVVNLISFLSDLDWPTNERYIIVFNEVNHSKEWGGKLDPAGYADVLKFTSNWAKSEGKNYHVMPAAMDLAAPNGGATMDSFRYWDEMRAADGQIFDYIDELNSHSYPNPGFSASPEAQGKNSLRGFTYELEYLKKNTGRDYRVFITETGWVENAATRRWLNSYYSYAMEHIWNDPRVVAVTPFILQGAPGPFAGFSFLNSSNQPTLQYVAYQTALQKSAQR
jgi:hypothetical protein